MIHYVSFGEEHSGSVAAVWCFGQICEDKYSPWISSSRSCSDMSPFTLKMFFRRQKADFVFAFMCFWRFRSGSMTTSRFWSWSVGFSCHNWSCVLALNRSSSGPHSVLLLFSWRKFSHSLMWSMNLVNALIYKPVCHLHRYGNLSCCLLWSELVKACWC